MSNSPTGTPVELASKGVYYKSGRSQVNLDVIRGEYEAMLADATSQTFPRIATQVLTDLSSDLPVDSFEKLLIGDKYHLLFELRIRSYPDGSDYCFDVTCPSCSAPNRMTVDLKKDVVIKAVPADAIEPFLVDLPTAGVAVKLRLMRVEDEIDMHKWVRRERQKKTLRGDPAYYYAIARGILEIDDKEVTFDEAVSFVKTAAGADTLVLRDALDDHDVGPELDMEFTCDSCNHYWWQRLPMGADFFRPGLAKRRRASRAEI